MENGQFSLKRHLEMEGGCWLWRQMILTELHFALLRDLVGLKADLPFTSITLCLEEHNDAVIPVTMVGIQLWYSQSFMRIGGWWVVVFSNDERSVSN